MMLLLLALSTSSIILYEHFSNHAKVGRNNIRNSRLLELGMNKQEVYSVMGKPTFFYESDYQEYQLFSTSNDSYPFIKIIFDNTGNVIDIFPRIRTSI